MKRYAKTYLHMGVVNINAGWIIGFVAAVCSVAAGALVLSYVFWDTPKSDAPTVQGILIEQSSSISPTPIPFRELTIPYLRERTYTSSVGELREFAAHTNYRSYTTTYTSDGLQIHALLTVPTGDEPEEGWPAIVFVHGYIPPVNYRTTEQYEAYVEALASRGFVVFKIDLRGHGSSEGEAGGAYYSSDYVIDTLNARAALATLPYVDADAIGVWGHSMAGNVAFRSMVAQNIPAVVIWAGAVYTYEDFVEYRIDDDSYRPPSDDSQRRRKRDELFATHGEFAPGSVFWHQVVPTNYISGVSGAIQIHHAVNDDVVDIRYSRNLMTILDGTSIIHQLHEYPSGGHNITGASFTTAMQRTADFFHEHLR